MMNHVHNTRAANPLRLQDFLQASRQETKTKRRRCRDARRLNHGESCRLHHHTKKHQAQGVLQKLTLTPELLQASLIGASAINALLNHETTAKHRNIQATSTIRVVMNGHQTKTLLFKQHMRTETSWNGAFDLHVPLIEKIALRKSNRYQNPSAP